MQSMTGYGKETSRQGDWEMTVELRAVNHRFLDFQFGFGINAGCRFVKNHQGRIGQHRPGNG